MLTMFIIFQLLLILELMNVETTFSGEGAYVTGSTFQDLVYKVLTHRSWSFPPFFPRFDITWFEVSLTGSKCLGPRCFWADLTRNHSSFYF